MYYFCVQLKKLLHWTSSESFRKSPCSSTKIMLSICLLYAFTFGILLPLTCNDRVFTQFIVGEKEKFIQVVRSQNDRRRLKAENYFRSLDPSVTRNIYETRLNEGGLDILIAITTVTRRTADGYELGYFKQVAASLINEIQTYSSSSVSLIICNVDTNPDSNLDAKYISQFLPSYSRNFSQHLSIYEKEKLDYLFCLQECYHYKARYILIVEDDAVPKVNFLYTLNSVLRNSLERRIERGLLSDNRHSWLALKLYYPERWLGYALEVRQMSELVGIALIGCVFFIKIVTCFLKDLYQQKWFMLLIGFMGAFYFVIFSLLVGRPNLLELRRLHPSFYNVVKAPGCCTPATLYPKSMLPSLIRYLNSVVCDKDFGLDIAIDQYSKSQNLYIYSVEPNLFTHIGFYSSLTKKNKENPEEFLFGNSAIDDLPN